MKKKLLFNFVITILALSVIFGSIMTIGYYGNLFSTPGYYSVIAQGNQGSVTVIRRGTGYMLKDGIGLSGDDTVDTSADAFVSLVADAEHTVVLDESSSVTLFNCSPGQTEIGINSGTVFTDIGVLREIDHFNIVIGRFNITSSEGGVFSVEVYEGTQTVNVYGGSVILEEGRQREEISAGENVTILQDEDKNSRLIFGKTEASRLSEFLIGELLKQEGVCFSEEELKGILNEREAETLAEKQKQKEREAEILAHGGTVEVIGIQRQGEDSAAEAGEEGLDEIGVCTLQIRCDTILDNVGNLSQGKERHVPKDGVILETTKAEFVQGETVYDVLKRVCEYNDIDLSYDWTVEYGGYYIEGINKLYEFDCGSDSGWMYKVNGWFPNYSCSSCQLKENDVVVWCYTCNGLGADVGCDWITR